MESIPSANPGGYRLIKTILIVPQFTINLCLLSPIHVGSASRGRHQHLAAAPGEIVLTEAEVQMWATHLSLVGAVSPGLLLKCKYSLEVDVKSSTLIE